MAVKKSAKKSVALKAPVKKVVAKNVAIKKVVKKTPAKRTPVKKVVAKRVVTKKVAKKVSVKKATKKVVAKKAVAKKASTRKIAPKTPQRIVIDAIAPFEISSSRVEIISTTPQPRSAPFVTSQEAQDRQGSTQSQRSSSRVVLAVIVGVILIAVFVVARNHNTSNTPKPVTPVAKPSATPSNMTSPSTPASPTSITSAPTTPTSPTPSTGISTSDLPPVAIVAHYNATGATIFWRADTDASGLTTYNIEKSTDGGSFKLIATVPATQLSLDVTETNTNGWSSFKVSAVYADGTAVAGKVFGLPGQYS